MRVAIIGRSEALYEAALQLLDQGHKIVVVITSKEAPEYTKTVTDFRGLAERLDIPFVPAPRIEGETVELLTAMSQIDVGVSMNYTGIISQQVIDLFRLGVLNAHGGDLPRYRGNACQAWAILNGEDRVGLCIHRMIGGELDNGDIVCRDYFPLSAQTKITVVYEWLERRIPSIFVEALEHLELDAGYVLERQSANPHDALRCYPRRPEDGKIFWEKSSLEILRIINACNRPYAGAFCFFEGEKVIVWDASLAPEENFMAVPGQITTIEQSYVEVACGAGKLRLSDIETPSGERNPGKLFRSIRQRLS